MATKKAPPAAKKAATKKVVAGKGAALKKQVIAQKVGKTNAPKSVGRKRAAQAATPAKKKPANHGRPTKYSEELDSLICARLAIGESLVTICKDETFPARATVMRWLQEDKHVGFRDNYARAREAQADFYAEEIIEIADEECTVVTRGEGKEAKEVEVTFDATAVARNRLRVDARKWYASKVAPKKYGDRTTLAGDSENPLAIMTMDQIAANPRSRLTIK